MSTLPPGNDWNAPENVILDNEERCADSGPFAGELSEQPTT